MKFTTAAVLAFACASALANSVPYEETAVYARDLYERGSGEGVVESFEKRRGRGGRPSLSRAFASAAGNLGGRVAGNAAMLAIQNKMAPPPPKQRRSLATMRRRRVPNGRPLVAASLAAMRRKRKGMATSFLNGFAQGVTARGLEEDVLDRLD